MVAPPAIITSNQSMASFGHATAGTQLIISRPNSDDEIETPRSQNDFNLLEII
jgi:hypothetical protein